MSGLRWLCAVAAFLGAALVGAPANAKPLELRVSLSIADESAPTHVCVISAGKGTDERDTIARLVDTKQLCNAANSASCQGPSANNVGAEFLFVPKAQQVDEPASEKRRLAAFRGTGETTNEHICDYGGGIGCRPVFRLDGILNVKQAFVSCVANDTYAGEPSAPGALSTRALVLNLLALHDEAGPHVQSLRLTGKQLLIGLSPTVGVDHLVRVLGGFYAPVGEARFTSDLRSASLAVEPRCEWTTVEVPRGVVVADVKTSLTVGSASRPRAPPQCVTSSSETSVRVLLPYIAGGKKVLRMSKPGSDPWALETSWYNARALGGRAPPLKMSVTEFSFEWVRDDCLYPGRPRFREKQGPIASEPPRCPSVESSTSGVTCQLRSGNWNTKSRRSEPSCHYTCARKGPGHGSTGVAFPTQVTFQSGDMRWTGEVDSFGHRSGPYVPPSERIFELDLEDWSPRGDAPTSREARKIVCPGESAFDAIYELQITTPDGKRTVDLHGHYGCNESPPRADSLVIAPFVKLPGASCSEPLQYRFFGERGYNEATSKIEGGRLKIEKPQSKARLVHYSVTVLPGSGQFVLTPRRYYTGALWAPLIDLGAVFIPRKRARGWRFNIDLTVMGSKRAFHSISVEPGRSEVVRDGGMTYYIRTYLGFSFLSPWYTARYDRGYGRAFAWGLGMQPGLGSSLKLPHAKRLGGPDWGLVALRVEFRVRFTRYLEGVFSPRLLLAERDVAFTTDFQGQPDRSRKARMVSLVLPGGLGFVW